MHSYASLYTQPCTSGHFIPRMAGEVSQHPHGSFYEETTFSTSRRRFRKTLAGDRQGSDFLLTSVWELNHQQGSSAGFWNGSKETFLLWGCRPSFAGGDVLSVVQLGPHPSLVVQYAKGHGGMHGAVSLPCVLGCLTANWDSSQFVFVATLLQVPCRYQNASINKCICELYVSAKRTLNN